MYTEICSVHVLDAIDQDTIDHSDNPGGRASSTHSSSRHKRLQGRDEMTTFFNPTETVCARDKAFGTEMSWPPQLTFYSEEHEIAFINGCAPALRPARAAKRSKSRPARNHQPRPGSSCDEYGIAAPASLRRPRVPAPRSERSAP